MATSVAHGLIGISTYCGVLLIFPAAKRLPVDTKVLLLAALLANLPDLDMLVSLLLLSDHKLLHGGMTHSFAFAALVAALLWLSRRRQDTPLIFAIIPFLLVSSHVLVDWLTGPRLGLHLSHGLAPFWPFSEMSLRSPVTLFKGVDHGDLLPGALYTAAWEMILIGPLTAGMVMLTTKFKNNHLSGVTSTP